MESKSTIDREELVQKNLEWARNVALAMYRRINPPDNAKEDFISSAYLGLVEAARNWNPKRQASFKTFAYYRIEGEIHNYIPRSIGLSYKAYRTLGKLRKTLNWNPEPGQSPVSELISFLGAEDFSARPEPNPEEACIKRERDEQVNALVTSLPPRLSDNLHLRYFKNKEAGEVAKATKLSLITISHHHRRALRYLRKTINARMPELQPVAA